MISVVVAGANPFERAALCSELVAFGYRALEIEAVEELRPLSFEVDIDVIIFDLDGDRVSTVHRARAHARAPIIALSSDPAMHDDRVVRDAGANELLRTPVVRGELMARIRSLVLQARGPSAGDPTVIEVGRLRIDPGRHEILLEGTALSFTPYEFRVLETLARKVGRVVSIQQLEHATWGSSSPDKDNNVRGLILRIRHLIEVDPKRPCWLITKRGVGYCLREDPGAHC